MGRMRPLRKSDGGVLGIVVGDLFRRLLSRTTAQQIAKPVETATSPLQYAQSTKAGTECVGHILQTLTDMDEKLTILSIDGIGAFDHVSRNSMLRGPDGDGCCQRRPSPFVRQFYGQPSAYVWDDEMGDTQVIPQGEGGEQGDPLMLLLFCLSLHKALVAVNARLQEGESLLAFLDDMLRHMCSRQSVGCASDLAARDSDPLLHLCPPWQDADLEPRRPASGQV